MCRWLAYSGSPVLLEELLYKPKNSLVLQSRHSRLGVEPINGDGFGVGWYGAREIPGLFRSTQPAWNDINMRELASFASCRRVFAHIRASTGTAVQQSNCHPFRYDRWLWMHNGAIAEFHKIKRDLLLAVPPELFPSIEGTTDSELFFYLSLGLGLAEDPPRAVARAVGLIERIGRQHGITHPIQMTVATTNGETTWAFRYSTERTSRSLFHSADAATLRLQYPDSPALHLLSDDARLIVSEPLGDLHGAWREVPESTTVTVHDGRTDLAPFAPLAA